MKNDPIRWVEAFPRPLETDHKYSRGQVLVLGGAEMTGAACLAAHATSRVGAGMAIIVSPKGDYGFNETNPAAIYRSFMPHLIVREGMGFLDYLKRAELKGICASIIGPGLGVEQPEITCKIVQDVLRNGESVVLDADALNVYEGQQEKLFDELHGKAVLTPHEGEFKRLFPDLKDKDRMVAAEEAVAQISGVLVLKGAHTIIAAKGHKPVINLETSPYLASAGTGDVLSGLIAGLLAQGMVPFDAACAAVWMHSRAAQIFGPGLIAGDLPDLIPQVLQEVLGFQEKLG